MNMTIGSWLLLDDWQFCPIDYLSSSFEQSLLLELPSSWVNVWYILPLECLWGIIVFLLTSTYDWLINWFLSNEKNSSYIRNGFDFKLDLHTVVFLYWLKNPLQNFIICVLLYFISVSSIFLSTILHFQMLSTVELSWWMSSHSVATEQLKLKTQLSVTFVTMHDDKWK